MENPATQAGKLGAGVGAAVMEGHGLAGLQLVLNRVVCLNTALPVLTQVVMGAAAGEAGNVRFVSGLQTGVPLWKPRR